MNRKEEAVNNCPFVEKPLSQSAALVFFCEE